MVLCFQKADVTRVFCFSRGHGTERTIHKARPFLTRLLSVYINIAAFITNGAFIFFSLVLFQYKPFSRFQLCFLYIVLSTKIIIISELLLIDNVLTE